MLSLANPTASTIELLGQVLDTVEDAFCVCDAVGRVLRENQVFQTLADGEARGADLRFASGRLARMLASWPGDTSRTPDSYSVSKSHELEHAGVCYRLRATPLKRTTRDSSLLALVSVEKSRFEDSSERLKREYGLTPREVQVAKLLSEGLSNKDIAASLRVSGHTARHHTERVLGKLGARSRAAFVSLINGNGTVKAPRGD